MEKTGESYTAARASLLAAAEPAAAAAEPPVLATSDKTIRARTGRGWEEWFDLLDEWGASGREHREIARWVAEQQGIEPLAWNAQAVTVSYERARGGRAVGERSDGFAITVTRTVGVPVERLFDAFHDPAARERWLPGAALRERAATRPRSARFDWEDGGTRVNVTFAAKDGARSVAALEHARLGDAEEAERMKAFWRERLTALKSRLEAGGSDA
jgi:uncharacterized protein YndB with AHSA1/START domain